MTDEIKMDYHFRTGPIGGHGFRSGHWPIKRGDKLFEVFASVLHTMNIHDQHIAVLAGAARMLAEADDGTRKVGPSTDMIRTFDWRDTFSGQRPG